MQKIKTVFFGSGEFAVPVLEALSRNQLIELVAVVTQPDRPSGRKKVLTGTPVKTAAMGLVPQVPLLQPEQLRKDQEKILEQFTPELNVVADYGQIFSEKLITSPEYKTLNVHASLLPDLRGAAPIRVALLNGYTETGVTIMLMSKGLDEGSVLNTKKIKIAANDNNKTLTAKLAQLGAGLLTETIPGWTSGVMAPQVQDEAKATYAEASVYNDENSRINASDTIAKTFDRIRAYSPEPGAWISIDFKGPKRLKIFSAEIAERKQNDSPENHKYKFLKKDKGLFLELHDGILKLNELQLEGKKRDTYGNYLFLAGLEGNY
jgi:methionyl-tRNA formyltransferase